MVVHEYTRRKMNKKIVSSIGENLVTKRSQSKEEHYPSVCVSVESSVGALPYDEYIINSEGAYDIGAVE
jgi:hypothetical protein